jgi:IS30 family transposase
MSSSDLCELWRRWRLGQSLSEIGRALEKTHCAVRQQLAEYGGISPPERRRSPRHLSLRDREEISRGLARGESLRCIARRLGRPASTISREVNRNSGKSGYRAAGDRGYRAVRADGKAWQRARRPKACKLAQHRRLREVVAFKLSQNWSPEQIHGWLRLRFPDDEAMRISHETIYRSLFIQARGVLKKELTSHLRRRRTLRQARGANPYSRSTRHFGIVDAIPISKRPAEAKDRAVPGHWEGDLIEGLGHSCVATLVERRSRYTVLVKVASKETQTVVAAIKKQITKLPKELRKSLTWDRGGELAHHKQLTLATDMAVYFCDPQSPWQRGTNENTNGLLRQYLPDGTDLSTFSQAELNRIARELNERPRKTLRFQTPVEVFSAALR